MENPGDYCRNSSNNSRKSFQDQPADTLVIEHHAKQHADDGKSPEDSTVFPEKDTEYYNSPQAPVQKVKN